MMNVLWATTIVVLVGPFVSTILVDTVVNVQLDGNLILMEIAVMVKRSIILYNELPFCFFIYDILYLFYYIYYIYF